MSDSTSKSVARQLKAMDCAKYRIGAFDRENKTMALRRFLEPGEVMGMVPWLKHQNASGKDIYITQADGQDRALLLVDDLAWQRVEAMAGLGVAPACVVETSPGNFQAWVSLGPEPMPRDERKAAARLLAEQFQGDMASADASHFGRLAGFTNRKREHLAASGYPFVKCVEARGMDAERSRPFREWARAKCKAAEAARIQQTRTRGLEGGGRNGSPAAIYANYFAEWSRRVEANGRPKDLSRGDFAVACRMLKEGHGVEQIASAMAMCSPNIEERKDKHIEDYTSRTVLSAMKIVNRT